MIALLPEMGKARAILLDIEGTITPADFVTLKLFGYARERIEGFLEKNSQNTEIMGYLKDIREKTGIQNPATGILQLMDEDSKFGPLKKLQELVWKEGYESGELKGEVYVDVPPAFKRWRNTGRSIFIYSSGSVISQRMLLATTKYGDLTNQIDGYFDTGSGGKKFPESYELIAGRIGLDGKNIAFFSDSLEEINAAKESGMSAFLVCRSGNCNGSSFITNFDGI